MAHLSLISVGANILKLTSQFHSQNVPSLTVFLVILHCVEVVVEIHMIVFTSQLF